LDCKSKPSYGGTSREIDATLTKFAQEPGGALLMTPDAFFTNRRAQLVTLAARYATGQR
jgi:hypothetical protein